MQFRVINTEEHQPYALLPDQIKNLRVVIALVFASHNQHHGSLHGLHSYIASINISGLGIIDVGHSVFHGYALQPVLYAGETDEALAYDLLVDA